MVQKMCYLICSASFMKQEISNNKGNPHNSGSVYLLNDLSLEGLGRRENPFTKMG